MIRLLQKKKKRKRKKSCLLTAACGVVWLQLGHVMYSVHLPTCTMQLAVVGCCALWGRMLFASLVAAAVCWGAAGCFQIPWRGWWGGERKEKEGREGSSSKRLLLFNSMQTQLPHTVMQEVCSSWKCGSPFTAPSKIFLDGAGLGPYSGGVVEHFLNLLFLNWKAFFLTENKGLPLPTFLPVDWNYKWLQRFARVCPHWQRLLKISSWSGAIQICNVYIYLFSYQCPAPWLSHKPLSLPWGIEIHADCQQTAGKISTRAAATSSRLLEMMQLTEITLRC